MRTKTSGTNRKKGLSPCGNGGRLIRVCPLVRHLGVSRSTDELKEYIITNNEKLTSFSQELYSIQDNNIIIYDSYEELPASSTAISDLYGNAKEGDYFEHDGGQTGERSRYRTEKICDNWYYFEEAVW